MHLPDHASILKTFYGLLKPGGFVGISDDDWGTAVQTPESVYSGKGIELMAKVIKYNGGDPYYSRNLRSLLTEAGLFT